jgi:type I site-specific restriction endonuclease
LFAPLPFERLNETDVREEIIAPLLRQLGYQTGSRNDVIREQSLRYPKISLGIKKPKKDPELRGKADYILEVNGRLRWMIEAKAPEVEIDIEAVEQAYTYANHPEIRAIYFVLCNGRTLSVFRTNQGPNAGAILSLPYEEFDRRFQTLKNLPAPEAVALNFPDTEVDEGRPLALAFGPWRESQME